MQNLWRERHVISRKNIGNSVMQKNDIKTVAVAMIDH